MKKFYLPLMVLAAVASLGASCSSQIKEANPIQAGCSSITQETAAVCGYATYGTFVAFQKIALNVATDVGPGEVREKLIDVEEKAKPVADKLIDSVALYENVRADLLAGHTTQEQLNIVFTDLQKWLLQAKPLIDDLVTAVGKAKAEKPL